MLLARRARLAAAPAVWGRATTRRSADRAPCPRDPAQAQGGGLTTKMIGQLFKKTFFVSKILNYFCSSALCSSFTNLLILFYLSQIPRAIEWRTSLLEIAFIPLDNPHARFFNVSLLIACSVQILNSKEWRLKKIFVTLPETNLTYNPSHFAFPRLADLSYF